MKILNKTNPEKPVSIDNVLAAGEYDQGDVALVAYDDIFDMKEAVKFVTTQNMKLFEQVADLQSEIEQLRTVPMPNNGSKPKAPKSKPKKHRGIIETAAGPSCKVCGRGVDCWLGPDKSPCEHR